LTRGDYLLLACDGLAAQVETATIQTVLSRSAIPTQNLARQLVSMADEGGADNCTVLVAHFALIQASPGEYANGPETSEAFGQLIEDTQHAFDQGTWASRPFPLRRAR
jgi:serine/threonine protein phosphatase PrpC